VIRLGLRFEPRDRRLLRYLAGRVRQGDLAGQAANVFEQAALAAETGEPLELWCTEPIEAVHMALAYSQYGVTAPTIEELSAA
jgi:hypothetical protein